ncbi:cupin domain-containing protein [Caulobacter sp.]|uniref:cupin domain-containing protein n=1 Tax=Caulobacter sp. TaxID=78 RepID=UPI003BB22240
MNRRLASAGAALLLAAVAFAGVAVAQDHLLRLTPPEIAALNQGGATAGTSGVTGIRTTVLYGDPTKAGPYTIALQVPPNTRIAAHGHRDDRTAVVIAGLWRFGYGRKADAALVKALPPGSFYSEPAGVDHFAMTGPEGASVYISGYGPTSTDYVEAGDAPKP